MFFDEPYLIFTVSALILIAITILEAISVMTMGSSMDSIVSSGSADGVDLHVGLSDDLSMDVFNSAHNHAGFDTGVNLLNVGKVPFMIVLAALTAWFTISGYSIHFLSGAFGLALSNYFVAPISFGIASLGTYFTTKIVGRLLPTEKSYSITERDLIGAVGVVVVGNGDNKRSVQVKTKDDFGTYHYVQGRVALPNISIKANDEVIILKKDKDSFYKLLPKVPDSVKVEKKQTVEEFLISDIKDVKEMSK